MNKGLITSLLGIAITAAATSAEAIPAFARKYDTDCSSCHTAYPQLNKAGRKFKEAGYSFPKLKGETTISDFLHWDEYFPASAVFKLRPYDKKEGSDHKIRSVHEVELMAAGRLYKNVSGYFELEAEDEDETGTVLACADEEWTGEGACTEFEEKEVVTRDAFEPEVSDAWMTYNHSDAIKLQATWGSILAMDPYDTYSGARRLTRGTQYVIDKKFGGADDGGNLGESRQGLSVFGRPMEKLFYSVGLTGNADDSEGVNGKTLFGRLAVDVMPDVMLGLLYVDGECEKGADNCVVDRDYTRFGIDGQADIGDVRVMGAWLTAEDDNKDGTSEEDNDSWYLHGQYVFKQDGRPTFVPMIRYDSVESNDGKDETEAVTLNLSYYFTQNIKGYVEYNDILDAPESGDEIYRLTFQIEAGF